jgi:tetratricopeptide (TPR) repeat protein
MTKRELETLKRQDKKRFYFNSFLSATEYLNLALFFAGARSYSVNSHFQSVVFEIEMNTKNNYHPRPYADISRFSEIQNENEILFTIGSIFDITVITFDEVESTWFIRMEPTSELPQQLFPMNFFWSDFPIEPCPVDYETEWRLLEVGHLLQFRSNSHDKTLSDIRLYYSLLRKYIPNSFSTAAAYVGIGILEFHQRYFIQSIEHLRKALKIYNQIIPIKSFYSVQKLVVNIKVPLRYYRSILCKVHEYIIIICLLLLNSIKNINRWCIQLGKIGFGEEQQCSVGSYVSIVRYLKTLGYYKSVLKLCASLKLSETDIMGTTLDSIVKGNGWNIMAAIMHIDIDDWYFYSKMKHNEQYFEYLSMTDRCDNAIQRVFHGTVIVCKYIADLYRKKQRMDLALTWYEMVITNIKDEFVPMYYSLIAEGFNESNEKNRALEYYAKAVDYWRKGQSKKCEVLSFHDLDDASLMLFDMKTVIDEVRRLPQYPWSCLITYGVPRIDNCDDIIAFHQNAYDSNDFLIRNRKWLLILGSDYCAHASRIYVDTGNFNMAVQWCGKAFELWPEQYRYRLITSKIDIIPLLSREHFIFLIQQLYKKQSQRLKYETC